MLELMKSAALAVSRSGSPLRLLVKSFQVLQNEGTGGIRSRISRFLKNDYPGWISKYDTITPEITSELIEIEAGFACKPLISVIMPVFDPDPVWLTQAIDSVRSQIYPNWELCIADDHSTNPEIGIILENFANLDHRIKVIFRNENGHIAACSNSALSLATGQWIALLDHDDLIAVTALHYAAECIGKNPEVKLIYSDEDKIDRSGNRLDPYFKPGWNPDLFYGQNLFSHLGVYEAELVRMAGGFRPGFEGSQDYDLVLRCLEHISSDQIHHIPRILYHWRIHKNSTSLSGSAKPYAVIAAEKALREHFDRTGIRAVPEFIGYGFRTRYAMPRVLPKVSLIIPTRNGFRLLRRCIDSIRKKTDYNNYEIIIIDNGSDDRATIKYLAALQSPAEECKIIRIDEPFNFSRLVNAGAAVADGEYLALLNNDMEVISKGWLTEMVSIAMQPAVGAVGAKLLYRDRSIQHAGIIMGLGAHRIAGCAHSKASGRYKGYFGRAGLTSSFSAVTAACLVVRKTLYERVGGFDEISLPVAFNDVDFCLKIKASGYRNVFTPFAELYHYESASRCAENTPEQQARFDEEAAVIRTRWASYIENDPAYNPNLSLDHSDFSLAFPPRLDIC